MRKMFYVLSDGTRVETLHEAELSGKSYVARLEKVKENKPVLSPIRKAMIEQFGYVSAKFKDKVVL